MSPRRPLPRTAPKPPPKPRPKGASQSRTRLADRLDSWQAHHSTTAVESLQRLFRTPLQSLLTWLVVAVAVALPAALYLVLNNIQNLGYSWQDSGQMSVFLIEDVRPEAIDALLASLNEDARIDQVSHVPPNDALEEFKAYSGLGRVLQGLEENPLPDVLLIRPATNNPDALGELRETIAAEPLVAEVRLDMAWVRRLQEMMALGQRVVLALATLLALGVLLAVGNTIRLAIENRRDEILVVKLVGGTDAFVRRPFLYTGLWYGLGGGILALVLLGAGLWWLSGPVARLADLYQSDFRLRGLDLTESLQLVLLSGVLGLLGAWLAVARHLIQIEPR
ncbi:permease-like cell division protein FtsX [Marinimicrobium agarilyticum]|uniref:permease-like cell division protein FtsX n=1 Tax=Marinimicrobium agarilyticum TaxID=306546 RepID=UPI0004077165|nr:permease-like cell division protein FtsX [Marinimicrobium agarilyticum]